MMLLLLGIAAFTAVIVLLVGIIVNARKALVPTGTVKININDEKDLETGVGGKLLNVLAENGIFVSSACGGRLLRPVPCTGARRGRRDTPH